MSVREALVIALAVLCALAATIGYQWLSGVGTRAVPPTFAVIDVLAIADGAQRNFENIGFDPKAGESERTAAIVAARAFGLRLEQSVAELAAHCRCVLLNRAAVVASHEAAVTLPDYTAELRTRLARRAQSDAAQTGALR